MIQNSTKSSNSKQDHTKLLSSATSECVKEGFKDILALPEDFVQEQTVQLDHLTVTTGAIILL